MSNLKELFGKKLILYTMSKMLPVLAGAPVVAAVPVVGSAIVKVCKGTIEQVVRLGFIR